MEQSLERMRRFFASGQTQDCGFRMDSLRRLRRGIAENEPVLLEAMRQDLGKSSFEAYECELLSVYREIDEAIRRLRGWSKPRRVKTPWYHFPAASRLLPEPLGVSLILSPWNYPFLLAVSPLVAAVAAGCCAVVKPSEDAPHTASALESLLAGCFAPEHVVCMQGGVAESERLLALPFDKIFFTGSPRVGRIVMQAAARNLTPVTLELGGKSPCIVDETADLALAAKRIVWGKTLNAGQTCVAPDYLLVHRSVKDALLQKLTEQTPVFYGARPLENDEYPRIINKRQFDRLVGLLEAGRPQIVCGGGYDAARLKIEPTVFADLPPAHPLMEEELFGPLLPVLSVDSVQQALDYIAARPKPLALYLFTNDAARKKQVPRAAHFGGCCINDTVLHVSNHYLPFGGVGESGMGRYHGRRGFEAFSHEKAVLTNRCFPDLPVRYPPYGNKLGLLKRLVK